MATEESMENQKKAFDSVITALQYEEQNLRDMVAAMQANDVGWSSLMEEMQRFQERLRRLRWEWLKQSLQAG